MADKQEYVLHFGKGIPVISRVPTAGRYGGSEAARKTYRR